MNADQHAAIRYMARGTIALMAPFLAAGWLVSLPAASADMNAAEPTPEAVVTPVAHSAKAPCQGVESRFNQAVRRQQAGDWLAADELAGLVTYLATECGWTEGVTLANAQAAR